MRSREPYQQCTTVNWENSDTTAVYQEFKMYPFMYYSLIVQLILPNLHRFKHCELNP
jgi:hypothetical protein